MTGIQALINASQQGAVPQTVLELVHLSTRSVRLFEMNKKGKEKMKLKLIGYWVATVLVASEQLLGGITDLVHGGTGLFVGPPVTRLMMQLGYPVYLLTFMGVWSLLGGITLLVPGFPRLKEWAYAGIFFLYTAAAFSKVVEPNFLHSADLSSLFLTPLVYALLTLVSWALRPPSRTLGVLFPTRVRRTNGQMKAPTEQQAVSR